MIDPEFWFAKRCIKFISMCMKSDNNTVKTFLDRPPQNFETPWASMLNDEKKYKWKRGNPVATATTSNQSSAAGGHSS